MRAGEVGGEAKWEVGMVVEARLTLTAALTLTPSLDLCVTLWS